MSKAFTGERRSQNAWLRLSLRQWRGWHRCLWFSPITGSTSIASYVLSFCHSSTSLPTFISHTSWLPLGLFQMLFIIRFVGQRMAIVVLHGGPIIIRLIGHFNMLLPLLQRFHTFVQEAVHLLPCLLLLFSDWHDFLELSLSRGNRFFDP